MAVLQRQIQKVEGWATGTTEDSILIIGVGEFGDGPKGTVY